MQVIPIAHIRKIIIVFFFYIYYFKYILLDIIMALLTFLHKGHDPGILVSIYMCTDCQQVEIIQTKSFLLDLSIYFLFLAHLSMKCSW